MILKKGTQVKIISGKDKGKTGEILAINRKLEKVKIKSGIKGPLIKNNGIKKIGKPNLFNLYILKIYKF